MAQTAFFKAILKFCNANNIFVEKVFLTRGFGRFTEGGTGGHGNLFKRLKNLSKIALQKEVPLFERANGKKR